MPDVEGWLLRVSVPRSRQQHPEVSLATDDGATVDIVLPEHTRAFAGTLAALPDTARRALRLRVFHLFQPAADTVSAPDTEGHGPLLTSHVSDIVLQPDHLLNITDINNAEYCVRQYPLRRMIPSTPSAATLRGTIIHAAFKELLKAGGGSMDEHLQRAMQAQLTDLALRQFSFDEVSAGAGPHLHALSAWYGRMRQNLWQSVPDIRAETFLLAPEVGLKGRLDFLMQDEHGGSLLELKTGNAYGNLPKRAHRWQVYGYQTLLAARRPDDERRPLATLLYSGTPGQAEGHGVPFTLRDLHRVLELRNQLVLVHATGIVPPPPGGQKCVRCSLREACLRASTLLGWEPPESEEQPVSLDDAAEAARFAHLYQLLRLEAHAVEAESRALWRLSPAERRELGIALGHLTSEGEPRMTGSGEWEYSFHCDNTSELREGDAVLLSDGDPVRGAVVSGTVLRLEERGVTIWTPERIANPALIDRYGSDIVHERTVRNLWRWLDADSRLAALVAGTRMPEFDPLPSLDDLPASFNAEQRAAVARALAARDYMLIQGPPGTGKTRVVAEIARRAVARGERVLVAGFTNQAVDTVLLRLVEDGMQDFIRLGHELSVTPALHPYRVYERARALAAGRRDDQQANGPDAAPPALDPALVRETLRLAPLVASTTATWSAERYDEAGEPLRFDLVIVDEASQLTVPALLGALRFARRFVLVGDERQLPPLVVSEEAAARGLKRSLFTDLLQRWTETASVALRRQYRMHPVICDFPSAEFYGGELVADGAARTALLDVRLDSQNPLVPILAPERPLVFIDVPARLDGEEADGKTSASQAEVVRLLILALRRAGVPAEEIGAIAPYRAQVATIRQRLAAWEETSVTVDTVDRFQGGERQIILFSFGGRVSGDSYGYGGSYGRGDGFLADPHRLNVALTRAERKLILVGDRRRLETLPLLARLITHCASLYGGRGGIVTAHSGALAGATSRG